jgi:hypothetical protein
MNSVTLTYIDAEWTWTYSKHISHDCYPASILVHQYVYRKQSLLYCCVLDHAYRAVAWHHVDQIRYIAPSLRLLVPSTLTVYHCSFFLRCL